MTSCNCYYNLLHGIDRIYKVWEIMHQPHFAPKGRSSNRFFSRGQRPAVVESMERRVLLSAVVVNSLADQHVNSMYFLTMNIGGDGKDVWPWIGPIDRKGSAKNEHRHFDGP